MTAPPPGDGDGRAALAAFIDSHTGLHDAEVAELRVDASAGSVSLLLREVWGDGLDAPALGEAELAFGGAHLEWEGRASLEEVPGYCVVRTRLDPRRLELTLDIGRLVIVFQQVVIRTAPIGSWLGEPPILVHASAVRLHDRGLLIRGASGAGKSALALDLMAFGCVLVADDRVELRRERGVLAARCPTALRGLIEARGVGLLHAGSLLGADIVLVADLDHEEHDRLPPWREEEILGVRVPVLHKPAAGGFAPALLQHLKAGRVSPEDPGGELGASPVPAPRMP